MSALTKTRKQHLTKLALILSAVLVVFSYFPNTSASIITPGNSNSIAWTDMSNAATGTNDLYGIGPINTTIDSGYWGVDYVAAFLSGGAPTKALIYDANGTLIFVSNPYTPNPAAGAWLNLYFPSGLTLRDNSSINVVLVTEWSNTMYWYTPGNSYSTKYNSTTATTYALPGSVSGFSTSPNKQLVYVRLSSTSYPGNMGGDANDYGQTTATPTPGPTAPPISDFGNGITTLVTLFFGDTPGTVGIGIPLIIIAVCAIASYKMAGAWGFFAGFNIGVILCFVFGILQLWVVIVTIIVDALLLYGKVPASNPNQGQTSD
jgi:hypothetical protein